MITRRIMENTEYSISSTSYDATERSSCSSDCNTSSFNLPSVSNASICNCQQRAAPANNKNCSLVSRQTSSKRNMPKINPVFLIAIILVVVSSFTCCVSAWPLLNQRRTFNYAPPPPVMIPDYNDFVDFNQWALAAQPDTFVDDILPELPLQQQQLDQDMYADQIYDEAYNDDALRVEPLDTVMVPVEREEELELKELKHQAPYSYKSRQLSKNTKTAKPEVASAPASSFHPTTATPASKDSSLPSTPLPHPSNSNDENLATQLHLASLPLESSTSGQKEIAMLRPPSSPSKSHHIQLDEPEEPKISVAQRSPSNEKPSAYDRLRKYLSLDDALKKENEERRANAMSRHHVKRSSIITDSDSLSGQLNNLKKKFD